MEGSARKHIVFCFLFHSLRRSIPLNVLPKRHPTDTFVCVCICYAIENAAANENLLALFAQLIIDMKVRKYTFSERNV